MFRYIEFIFQNIRDMQLIKIEKIQRLTIKECI